MELPRTILVPRALYYSPASFGVAFCDALGHLSHNFTSYIGHDSNNAPELWALTSGIKAFIHLGFHQLIVKGDSQIIFGMLDKILNGSELTKNFPRWRLLSGLESMKNLLSPCMVLIVIDQKYGDLSCISTKFLVHPLISRMRNPRNIG